MVEITDRSEYEYVKARGFEPLYDWRNFRVTAALRIQLQREIFSHSFLAKTDVEKANNRFYNYCWGLVDIHICENCLKPLHEYSAVFISHIISRGSRSEMAHDLRNHNKLCYKCHNRWESPNNFKMNIYPTNLLVINLLKEDYHVRYKTYETRL